MRSIRAEHYESTYQRALKVLDDGPAKTMMRDYHEKYREFFEMLENPTLDFSEKERRLYDFENQFKGIEQTIEKDTSIIDDEFKQAAEAGIIASKDTTKTLVPVLAYYCEDINTEDLHDCFNLDFIYKNQYLLDKAKVSKDLKPNLKPIDALLKMDEFSKEEREKQANDIKAAQKLLAKYEKSGKELVVRDLSKKDFKKLKNGIEAIQIITAKASNYLVLLDQNSPELAKKQILTNKDNLIKLQSNISVRTNIPKKKRKKILRDANIPALSKYLDSEKIKVDKEKFREILDEQNKKALQVDKTKNQGLANNYLAELMTALNKANNDIKVIKQIALKDVASSLVNVQELKGPNDLNTYGTFKSKLDNAIEDKAVQNYLESDPKLKNDFYVSYLNFNLVYFEKYFELSEKPDQSFIIKQMAELKKLPGMEDYLKQNSEMGERLESFMKLIKRVEKQGQLEKPHAETMNVSPSKPPNRPPPAAPRMPDRKDATQGIERSASGARTLPSIPPRRPLPAIPTRTLGEKPKNHQLTQGPGLFHHNHENEKPLSKEMVQKPPGESQGKKKI